MFIMIYNSLLFFTFVHFTTAWDSILPDLLSLDVNERIWNGRNARPGQFSYQALLYMERPDGRHSFCGGSLITTRHVLTAAHCCEGLNSTTVFLGLVNASETHEDYVQKFFVPFDEFIIHEEYDSDTIANDICILRLPNEATINNNVSTVALPESLNRDPSKYDGKAATISGWGQTNDREALHPMLQWSTVTVKSHRLCVFVYIFLNRVSTSQICSSKLPYTGPCHGDSGGPMTVKDPYSGKQTEIGIVSWGAGGCSSIIFPIVFTYVPYYVDWIKNNIDM